jgi:hypothetical protein
MTFTALSKRSRRLALVVAVCLVGTLGPWPAPLLSIAAAQKSPVLGREQKVLLFPVSVEAPTAPEDTSRWATNALQAAIDELPNMVVFDFARTSPLARQAVREGRIRSVDLEQPITDPQTAISLGHALQMDVVILAVVQSYRLSTEPVQVEVLLTGQAYDVKANFDEETLQAKAEPQVLRAFGVPGRSRPRARYGGPEGVLAREALGDAAYRAAQIIAGVPPEQVGAKPAALKKDKGWRWFLFLATVAGLAAAANSGTHHGASAQPTPAEFKPRNLQGIVQPAGQNAILVTWLPPLRTEHLLGYELERAQAAPGAASPSSYARIAGLAQLSATTTQWLDHGLNPSYIYYYRLRARYSDRNPSAQDWISIGGIGFSSAP